MAPVRNTHSQPLHRRPRRLTQKLNLPDSPCNNEGGSPANNNEGGNPANNSEGGNPAAAVANTNAISISHNPFDAKFAYFKQTLNSRGISDEQLIRIASQTTQSLGPGMQEFFTQSYKLSKARLSALQDENEALKKRLAAKEIELVELKGLLVGKEREMKAMCLRNEARKYIREGAISDVEKALGVLRRNAGIERDG